MGKKKDKKKGHGAEKTAFKTDKKQSKREKKNLAALGEEDIESMLAEFKRTNQSKTEVTVSRCMAPSPRVNMSLCPHPERPELFMFGGEFCAGNNTSVYSDLFVYNIKKQEWSQISSPNCPPPRCSHQAVMLPQGGGQMWVFGGEFASPSQSQFYHHKDLWVYHVKDCRWEQVAAKGGPSARSGHRMVAFRKCLIVFGGFHDNLRECKYYNDVYVFNLETRVWTKIEPSGIMPPPRSASHLFAQPELGRLIMFGGYSKEQIKKDSERGVAHSDMYVLTMDDKKSADPAPLKWKWQNLRPSGDRPSLRSGASSIQLSEHRALLFGGVFDNVEDDENLESQFYNDQYIFDLEKTRWHTLLLNGPKQSKSHVPTDAGEEPMETDDVGNTEENTPQAEEIVHDDGVFTVRIGPSSTNQVSQVSGASCSKAEAFVPNPRMNCVLTYKQNTVYMYGGMYETGDKQVTLDDFYCLDVSSMSEWKTLSCGTYDQQVWEESDDSESSDSEDDDSDDEDMDS